MVRRVLGAAHARGGIRTRGGISREDRSHGEGCATFARRDKWRVASARVVDLKVPGPLPEERDTDAWVRTQPHLRDALSKISTVAHICVLEPIPRRRTLPRRKPRSSTPAPRTSARCDGGCRRSLVVANTHLFFHPGAVHDP